VFFYHFFSDILHPTDTAMNTIIIKVSNAKAIEVDDLFFIV